ncbi:glutaredoxin domain-containing cysteine-rich protein CG12206-like [Trichogramma pretiosum]|uniref:glutaredoxin domain-containing cysteine-rich protein CG12206-like n=1 Tax=Trichogramma pretiosum TaxID=7493 RepID=UPI0006C961F4|nr:glutaredoxin domain-containing cysteine-rich protein CG12206-like [Trichogramma pretiosum]
MSALTATSPGAQSISIGGPVRPSTNGSHSYQQQSQNQQQQQLGTATVYVTASPTPSLGSQDGDQQQQAAAAHSAHVVKIRISPSCNAKRIVSAVRLNEEEPSSIITGVSLVSLQKVGADNDEVMHVSSHGPVRISVKSTYSSSESVGSSSTDMNTSKETLPGCFCCSSPPNSMLSGHCSPSETLDSGTCSDLDGTPPPPSLQQRQLLKKTSSSDAPTSMMMPTLRGSSGSATSSGAELDSDDDVESSISCDSIEVSSTISSSTTLQQAYSNNNNKKPLVSERTYEERSRPIPIRGAGAEPSESNGRCYLYEDDRHYQFHVNEREEVRKMEQQLAAQNLANASEQEQEFFAGVQTGRDKEAIRSAKGTVRGVKNRVRAGIATFLQTPAAKNYKTLDAGKVVLFTTSGSIIRSTSNRCQSIKKILDTHMAKYEVRDLNFSSDNQKELKERMRCNAITVPQLFIDGEYIGDANTVERLNETGELRQMLKPYKSLDVCNTCQACGGYRLLPCPVCNGSKKSVHRNDFTAEFVALKCMNCDEVGLVRCQYCCC